MMKFEAHWNFIMSSAWESIRGLFSTFVIVHLNQFTSHAVDSSLSNFPFYRRVVWSCTREARLSLFFSQHWSFRSRCAIRAATRYLSVVSLTSYVREAFVMAFWCLIEVLEDFGYVDFWVEMFVIDTLIKHIAGPQGVVWGTKLENCPTRLVVSEWNRKKK